MTGYPIYSDFPSDPEQLKEAIIKQIEYYFCTDNLCKDIFLRKNMDSGGWVSLEFLSTFNMVRKLTNDQSFIATALKNSREVEVNSTNNKVRKKLDWQIWLFPQTQENQESTD